MYKNNKYWKIGKALLGHVIQTPENFYMQLDEFYMTPDDMPDDDPVKEEIWKEAFPVFIGDEGNAWASLDFVLENHKHIIEGGK
tara:strand:- start:537 stop:788 length:252 start_codon:yes stop_codon:yes gene_type:complete